MEAQLEFYILLPQCYRFIRHMTLQNNRIYITLFKKILEVIHITLKYSTLSQLLFDAIFGHRITLQKNFKIFN